MRFLDAIPPAVWPGLVMVGLALWADDVRGLYIAGAFFIVALLQADDER